MRVNRISISNFRGISRATLKLPQHAVLIGDNNIGKTTILEALDLVLGPDRLNRHPPIDEHDFFCGRYFVKSMSMEAGEADEAAGEAPESDSAAPAPEQPIIEVEVAITNLNDEQKGKFGDYIEFWDARADDFYNVAEPAGVDAEHIAEALRVTFRGRYDAEEDDFEGETFFTRSLIEGDEDDAHQFTRKHKQICGFIYLRSLRTGSRALSLERGSLLDIILRLKEVRPQMWEDTIAKLSVLSVAEDAKLGLAQVLQTVDAALKKYVPKEWGVKPHLRVTELTREHLRKVITAFLATGDGEHAAPFNHQGTGTINMLVLAMLSLIAEDRQNVIFAMEEPETAIPPYAQKRIVHEVRKLTSQTIFTSHSPYVLEEFQIDETVVIHRDKAGLMERRNIELPPGIKAKNYRQDFRQRFSEGLLSRRVLVAEGYTEAAAFPTACRRLAELNPAVYSSLEALGICTVNATSDSQIAPMVELLKGLGKKLFCVCDKQKEPQKTRISDAVDLMLEHEEYTFEKLVSNGTTLDALSRFAANVSWPPDLGAKFPEPQKNAKEAVTAYLDKYKGEGAAADFLAQCAESEIPEWLRKACIAVKNACIEVAPAEPQREVD